MSHSCVRCCAAAVAATTVLAAALMLAWTRHLELTAASTVHAPLLSILADLQSEAQTGDRAQLARKIGLLKSRWQAYAFQAGESPELFVPRLKAE